MKIKINKTIGLLALSVVLVGNYTFTSAYSSQIVSNPNNGYFFGSSSYAENYYANNQAYEYNYNSPCYGFKSCYSVNYVQKTNIPNYNYNNGYNLYDTGYGNGNKNYYNYNYDFTSPISVYSVPQSYWTNESKNTSYGGNYNYYYYGY